MIRFGTPELVPDLKTLWQVCFSEQQAYVDFAFDKIIVPERVMVSLDETGKPLAMLCLQPATLTATGGLSCPCAYIYGVATLPRAQGKGLSTKLMEAAHKELKKRGYALSALVPASEGLFGFYGSRGYETAINICKHEIAATEIAPAQAMCVLSPTTLPAMERERNAFFESSCAFVRWEKEYLLAIDAECRLSGGEVLRISCGGQKGYAVCYRGGDTVVIKELVLSPSLLDTAMTAIHRRMNAQRYLLYLQEDFGAEIASPVLPFAMVKWYDKKIRTSFEGAEGKPPYLTHVLD